MLLLLLSSEHGKLDLAWAEATAWQLHFAGAVVLRVEKEQHVQRLYSTEGHAHANEAC